MVSERTFLMKLFLCKTTDEVRDMCVKRSEELDEAQTQRPVVVPRYETREVDSFEVSNPVVAQQSPSMQRLMAQNPDLIPKPAVPATPAAAMALQARAEMINRAVNGDKGEKRTSPRKF